MGQVAKKAAQAAKPTNRQLAAQRRAQTERNAKQWLAGRKDSETPAADRLMARMMGEGWIEHSAREKARECLTFFCGFGSGYGPSYIHAEMVARDLHDCGMVSARESLPANPNQQAPYPKKAGQRSKVMSADKGIPAEMLRAALLTAREQLEKARGQLKRNKELHAFVLHQCERYGVDTALTAGEKRVMEKHFIDAYQSAD